MGTRVAHVARVSGGGGLHANARTCVHTLAGTLAPAEMRATHVKVVELINRDP